MRRLTFDQFGSAAEVLRLVDVPVPEPGSDQVLLRLTARPVNPSDLLAIAGTYGRQPTLPAVPGSEAVGQVEAVGADVRDFEIGQRVLPVGVAGTWQEYAVAPAAGLIPMPDTVPDNIACQALVNPLSAHLLLFEVLNAKPGDWIVQTAAGSGVGRLVIQLAAANGINLINVVRRRAGVDALKALGAEHVVTTEDEDLVERINTITGKVPVTQALDAVGGPTGAAVAEALGYGGELVVYGALDGPISVNPARLIFKSLILRGFWLTDWMRLAPPEHRATTLAEIVKLIAAGKLTPTVEAEYDLADFAAAIAHTERPGRAGKIILVG